MSAYLKSHPTHDGFFGPYGGAMLPPPLEPHFAAIREAYGRISKSADFIAELRYIRKHFQGRPTPVSHLKNLSALCGGAQIYAKREDLNHTGAHKLNHCMAEGLLARFMGKTKLMAETGAGQHGVALATAAAYFGMECEIHMGEIDIAKEAPNVTRMKLLGATVVPVGFGGRSLKEAVDSCFQSYLAQADTALFAIGSVVGPHPFPMMVRDFQHVVGVEAREQFLEMTGELPDMVAACVGGGSNAMGIFSGFLDDEVALYGIEPCGTSSKLGDHAATIAYGEDGDIHGFRTMVLKDAEGNPAPVHTVASGLDYPGVGPEHAFLHRSGRVTYTGADDREALAAFFALSRHEGIIPALESAHAVAFAMREAKAHPGKSILVNLSGRGDKDIDYVTQTFGFGETA
ncbi:tryptophan synthase subunit beta [Rhodobacter sphaeroides]|jgi:tryptophan synthase, beta subunit|uniref:Tryptophan synthase beta chain n=2 Tax=Cereibacter sphaeroides TaxID=1063 RepID=Q3J6C8_CERS4|nr:tryptophan synthase subunit beta [Cereibacter sphaeroides]ABN75284.1 tryptophan synthase, beta subunit [Cereibacter sphaeroides ATCC 17029]ABA77656.1 tryptophan synthase subunit beta [Cereibacter sphaeroides 2.4.1]AMJ46060.1 tryptophan synthase subunit beta [Cereibacter sphaeroides]ANS32771.1 tryptophan synthase subunit beta [Cereibacter sphaeroides]ATN61824.1 tryptophan synthase subunit beta [Cereibacter sphaeroides]